MKEYRFPTIDLLLDSPDTSKFQSQDYVLKKKEKLQEMFDLFGMDAKIVDCHFNSIALLIKLQLGEGTSSKAVRDRRKDIELVMEDAIDFRDDEDNERIMFIAVKDMNRPKIALKDILYSNEYRSCQSTLPVAAGIDLFGGKLILNLEEIGNLLIVGVTGSGKSVFLGDLITSILFRARPDEVQFLFFDFKGVELPLFNQIPHLIVPSVKSREQALDELRRLEETANKRLFLLATANMKSFEEYNRAQPEPLPRIILVIDEFMSLMDKRGKTDAEFTRIIRHLATTTKLTGIHLVLSTQRPSSSIISKEISEAIPHRVSFYVMSGVDSRIAINRTGAQRLLGEGDMIYADINSEQGTHAQAALITDAEIDRVIRFCNGQQEFGIEDGEEASG